MRRYVLGGLLLASAVVAGAAMYTVYASDREYVRLIAAGDEAFAAGQSFQALEAYSGAVALRPDAMLAHLKRGMVYRSRGELTEALKDLRRSSLLDPTATRPAELLGDTYLELARFEQAAARYEAYLAVDDRTAAIWYKLGLARYRAGRPADAVEPLGRALALDQGLAEAHLLLGLSHRDLGRTRPARASLETAARLAPGMTAPREALAALFRSTGDNARAIDQLEALAALDPARPQRLVALGLAHARSRRYDAAVLILSRAVERFPDEATVYAALGRVWLEAADARDDDAALRSAIEALSTAASQPGISSAALTDLGRAWLIAGNPGSAERAVRRAIDARPVEPEAYLVLATLSRRGGRTAEARDSLIRYATLVGDEEPLGSVAAQIAADSLRLGEPQVARRWIDRAVEESGPTPALLALRRRAERSEPDRSRGTTAHAAGASAGSRCADRGGPAGHPPGN